MSIKYFFTKIFQKQNIHYLLYFIINASLTNLNMEVFHEQYFKGNKI